MNFDAMIEIFSKGFADDYRQRKAGNTPTSSSTGPAISEEPNKDSQAPEPAETPNNAGQAGSTQTESKGVLERFKDEGGYSGVAEAGARTAAAESQTSNASMDAAQSRTAQKRQNTAQRTAARTAPVATQKSFNPALASLLAVAAGYASSDAFISGAGGRTNKDITDGQIASFNRVSRNQTKARQQTKRNRAITSKVKNIRLAYKEVSDDEHVARLETVLNPDGKKGTAAARAEIEAMREAKRVEKAHAPVPPIQGLVWDQSVKKWRKPENVGKTATEVQGKKRIRGSGLGQAGRSAGGSGSGRGRGRIFSGGRKGRAAEGDIGVAGKSRRISAKSTRRSRRK